MSDAILALNARHRNRIEELETAIRRHRDYRGDDRCVGDNHELYCVLPEGDTRPVRETLVTIENCERYIACQQEPGREYVSPQREIERLETQRDVLLAALEDLFVNFTAAGGDGGTHNIDTYVAADIRHLRDLAHSMREGK